MKKTNLLFAVFAIAIVLTIGLACKSLTLSKPEENAAKPNAAPEVVKTADEKNAESPIGKKVDNPNIEKADFTVTAEEFAKEFTREGVTDKDLEKYANKNIAVSGRVSMLVMEKKGTTQPWVTLYAPGIGNGVSCYFDDENVAQMKLLKEDKKAKVQGFQDDFIVPKVSPRLEHCIVLEAN